MATSSTLPNYRRPALHERVYTALQTLVDDDEYLPPDPVVRDEAARLALDDVDLIERTYNLVHALDSEIGDRFYFILGEVFERFAPKAYVAQVEREHRRSFEDEEEFKSEFEATLASIRRRAELRARDV